MGLGEMGLIAEFINELVDPPAESGEIAIVVDGELGFDLWRGSFGDIVFPYQDSAVAPSV